MLDEQNIREFEWDEIKNKSNVLRHKIDFKIATLVFKDTNRVRYIDNRKNYGEIRYQVIGEVLGNIIFVVYTIRRGRIRIISARKADKKERSEYDS